jgi:hypothetical protein
VRHADWCDLVQDHQPCNCKGFLDGDRACPGAPALAAALDGIAADYFTCVCTADYLGRALVDPRCHAHVGVQADLAAAAGALRAAEAAVYPNASPSLAQWANRLADSATNLRVAPDAKTIEWAARQAEGAAAALRAAEETVAQLRDDLLRAGEARDNYRRRAIRAERARHTGGGHGNG